MKNKLIICSVLIHTVTFAVTNNVQKMFFHINGVTEQQRSVLPEWGSVVFYFADNPEMIERGPEKTSSAGYVRYSFIFPHATVDTDFEDRTKESVRGLPYHVQFKQRDSENDCPVLTITIDPKQVCLKYERFESVTGKKSLVFHFQNKKLLEKLSLERTLLKCAARKNEEKKSLLLLLMPATEVTTMVPLGIMA